MRIGIALPVALFATVVLMGGPRAQTADSSQMQAFTQSDFYKGLINGVLAGISPTVFQRCPTLVSNGSRVTVLKPISFGPDGFPNAGVWKQGFPVSGCGNDTVLNLYFSAGADKKINTLVGIPGTTIADPTLQRDAMVYANAGATIAAKGCKDFIVKNTRFERYGTANPPIADPGPGKPSRPWWETWTMAGCGHTIELPMDFVPDKTGTQVIQPGGGVER